MPPDSPIAASKRSPRRPSGRRAATALLFSLVLAAVAFGGCATTNHAQIGNFRIVSGKMGPIALKWEIAKASAAGWEVVSVIGDGEDKVITYVRRDKTAKN